MKKTSLLLLFTLLTYFSPAQKFEKVIVANSDPYNLYVNDGDSTDLYYLKAVPKSKPIGVIVILPSGGEPVQDLIKQITLPKLAYDHNILTVIPSINWGTEDREVEFEMLDNIFTQLVKLYDLPKNNFIFGGLSNGGIISIMYAQHAIKEKDSRYLIPKGVFALDVPLDKAHFYEYCQREIQRNFSQAGVAEAHWMLNNYNELYGGSPSEFPDKYVAASIYSNGVENGGNAQYLKDMPLRMYTDLDVDWLINERRRDLSDWNGTNIVAMINDLKLMGNEDAQVLISMRKGRRLNGQKNPHSWSIMDNDDCFNWILKLIKEQ